MASKRKQDSIDLDKPPAPKRKGFSVGPANLPDGTHRRKVQKIKADLIHKAKVKKTYEKIKSKEPETFTKSSYAAVDDGNGGEAAQSTIHPARQAMIDATEGQPEVSQRRDGYEDDGNGRMRWRKRRQKLNPFAQEEKAAQDRIKVQEARQNLAQAKRREREALVRARRPDQFGKRRLGRESKALLDKVRRVVAEDQSVS